MLLGIIVAVLGSSLLLLFGMVHLDKTSGDRSLENPFRRALHALVSGRPGIRLQDLWRALQAPRGTGDYHLTMLAQAGKVRVERANGSTRVFPAQLSDEEVRDLCLLLRGRILEFAVSVKNRPGSTQKDLLAALAMSRKVFRDYANQLRRHRLVDEVPDYPYKRYFATPRLEQLLPMLLPETQLPNPEPDELRWRV